jgi:hypothetical protein
MYTHYIYSVVVQDFVSGRACCVNKYHYKSLSWRVVVQFVHATGKTWYKVLYKHTMYVISLSNISVKTNFKEITRVEIRLTNLYNTMRETTFCAWHLFVAVHSIALLTLLTLTCFTPYSNDMTSWQNSSAVKISCNFAPFFYHHSVVIQPLVSDSLLSLSAKENVQNVR